MRKSIPPSNQISPANESSPFAERGKKISRRRLEILRLFEQLRRKHTAAKSARMVKVSPPTLWRWGKNFKRGGLAALEPDHSRAGRRSVADGLSLSFKAIREIERRILETGTKKGWEGFLHSPHCPATISRMGLKSPPAPFLRMFKLTPLQGRCKAFVSADGRRMFIKLPQKLETKG